MYRIMMLVCLGLCATTTALAAPAPAPAHAAATPLSITRAINADGVVSIDNGAGSIQVLAWDQPEVQVTGTQPAGAKPPVIESSAGRFVLRIRAKQERCWLVVSCSTTLLPVNLVVRVPRGVQLDLHSVSADARVQGLRGGKLDFDSVSGGITLGDATLGAARLHTVSGSLQVDAGVARLEANSVSGTLRGNTGCAQAQATTVSGDIDLRCADVTQARLKSISGTLRLTLSALAPGGSLSLNSVSGDARLMLPKQLSARLDAGSLSGSIGGALPAGVTVREHSVRGIYGTGAGDIHVQTLSGDIRLQQGG
jgi:hypothetical protein